MAHFGKLLTLTALAGLVAVPTAPASPQRARAAHRVTVVVNRVAQVDNLDKFDVNPDRADFYAKIKIGNDKVQSTKNFSQDDGAPNWKVTSAVRGRYVPIMISLWDDDGGLEEKDDHVDVCPAGNKKDLNLTYDTVTGRITGDVSGRRNQVIYARGGGDDDKGKIWFTVK
jgi:hypothetical protein